MCLFLCFGPRGSWDACSGLAQLPRVAEGSAGLGAHGDQGGRGHQRLGSHFVVPPRARRDQQLPNSPLGLQRPQGKAALPHSPTGLYFLLGTFPKVSMPAREDARVWKVPAVSRAASHLELQLSRRNTGTGELQPAGCAPDSSECSVCAGEEVTPTLMRSCWPHARRGGTQEGTAQPPWKCPDPGVSLGAGVVSSTGSSGSCSQPKPPATVDFLPNPRFQAPKAFLEFQPFGRKQP